jgi:hypothetical protein
MDGPRFVIITTRLPPQVCGVGTYSWLLQQHWPIDDSRVEFLVIDGAALSTAELGHSAIWQFNGKGKELSHALDRAGNANVILHYAGRAYHRFGCPVWLPPVLQTWRTKFPAGRLLIFFHELPSTDFAITSRFFWIGLCNRGVVRKLARLADVIVTNTTTHVRKIEEISGRKDAQLIPIGSNIEPVRPLVDARVRGEFMIFGLPFGRWQTLQMFDREIRSWRASGVLTKLHLVGPGDEKFDRHSDQLTSVLPGGTVLRHGFLPSAAVSDLLSRVQFGLTNTTPETWSKSGSFMAFAAHGCAVVGKTPFQSEPLRYTVSTEELPGISDVELVRRQRMLKQWYAENADWAVTGRRMSALMPVSAHQEPVT